ncbi:UTP--glucose-1-phosphate uridylyltransferase [Candidatus Liberibacter africanus]|nr:UTP--glucose-1-phosphate uridylyltransferase [Candidatus Liberibacter africanus]QTP63800.1 UTP--glucose-1-phosphate uridylyltransferase [Candidatus Liberibacter africanus]
MRSFKKLRKAVFPAAGLGTRFLPISKVVPKEMLSVVDRPVIQYVVEEALEAGLTHFIFVIGPGKGLIKDYFDYHFELEQSLKKRNKKTELTLLQESVPSISDAVFAWQHERRGLGHAVWCARHIVGDNPFALLLPDVIMSPVEGENCMARMMKLYEKEGTNIISVTECDPQLSYKYGMIQVDKSIDHQVFHISDMVEKPDPSVFFANFFINGRYILNSDIFNVLDSWREDECEGEIQLVNYMCKLLEKKSFLAYHFKGNTYDCGSKKGLILANLAFALARKDIRSDIAKDLKFLLSALK